nr:hypothetical protein [Tanacetum cinerariifolium]
LFNSLKIYEAKVKSSSSASTSTQNIAFMSSFNTNSTNEPIDADDLEEMDLKWKMAMKGHFARECRSPKDTRRNGAKPQRRNVLVENSTSNALVSQCDGVGSYDWSFQVKKEPTNYALMAFTSSSSSSDNKVVSCSKAFTKAYATLQSHYDKLIDDFRKSQFDVISYKTRLESVELRDNALVVLRQNLKKVEQGREDFKLKYQSGDGYHVVPPPYTRTFMPPKPELVFHNSLDINETVHTAFNIELSPTKPNNDLSHTHRPSTPIIEDWVFDLKDESETKIQ